LSAPATDADTRAWPVSEEFGTVNGGANIRGTLQLPATGTASTTTKGFNSQPLDYLASVFNGTAAVNQHFRWQVEPVNPGLSTASGKLNLLFASGATTPGETGLSISNKGLITFATGQTFPTVTGNETVTGNLTAKQLVSNVATGTPPLQVTSTTQVPNLNASLLGGMPRSAFATLGANSFTGNQNITSPSGPAVFGESKATTGNTSYGVVGVSNSASASGVAGYNNSSGAGVFGTGGIGIKGVYFSNSASGSHVCCAAVWGNTGATGSTAVVATADSGYGVEAVNNGSYATIYASNASGTEGVPVIIATGGEGRAK
jgi:hypothetical protein